MLRQEKSAGLLPGPVSVRVLARTGLWGGLCLCLLWAGPGTGNVWTGLGGMTAWAAEGAGPAGDAESQVPAGTSAKDGDAGSQVPAGTSTGSGDAGSQVPAGTSAGSGAAKSRPPVEASSNGDISQAQLPSVILYEDLERLIKDYSPQVQMERIPYESRLARYEDAKNDIMETRRMLREEAEDMEKNGDKDGASHYRAQAKILKDAADDMDGQIRHAKGSSSTMSLRQMEDTMLYTAQRLMGTYHTLKLERDASLANAELKQSQYEKLQSQAGLGAASQAQADEALKAAEAALNHAHAAKDQMERTRKDILLLMGYALDSQTEIGPMPEPQPSRADNMGRDSDKWKALGNNYELRQQRGGGSHSSNKDLHAYQREVEQGEQGMYGRMDTLYQEVTAARSAWNSAVTAMVAQEQAFGAAAHKMDLGMLSRQEYLEARAAYMEAAADKGRADVDFQQAMDAYDWAIKGLMM